MEHQHMNGIDYHKMQHGANPPMGMAGHDHHKMILNLKWATDYKVVTLSLAAGVLYHWGILLSPTLSAKLMALVTMFVAINASMLKVKK